MDSEDIMNRCFYTLICLNIDKTISAQYTQSQPTNKVLLVLNLNEFVFSFVLYCSMVDQQCCAQFQVCRKGIQLHIRMYLSAFQIIFHLVYYRVFSSFPVLYNKFLLVICLNTAVCTLHHPKLPICSSPSALLHGSGKFVLCKSVSGL